MFTSIDKAVVAFILSSVFMLESFTGISLPVSEAAAGAIGVLVTTLAVYFTKNKDAA